MHIVCWHIGVKILKACPFCGNNVPDEAIYCLNCSSVLNERQTFPAVRVKKKKKKAIAIIPRKKLMGIIAIVLSVAIVLWQKLIAINGVNKIAPFSTLRIVFGIAAGVLMFNDPLSWQILLGSTLVTIGVILTMKEFTIILKARTKSIIVYRNAHRVFMERRLKRISLRKRHK